MPKLDEGKHPTPPDGVAQLPAGYPVTWHRRGRAGGADVAPEVTWRIWEGGQKPETKKSSAPIPKYVTCHVARITTTTSYNPN